MLATSHAAAAPQQQQQALWGQHGGWGAREEQPAVIESVLASLLS